MIPGHKLEEAFDEFIAKYSELGTPEEADGRCGYGTDIFMDIIEDYRLEHHFLAFEVHFVSKDRIRNREFTNDTLTPVFPYEQGPKLFHQGCRWKGHIVACVDGICVDWTARQFDKEAPFPLIFPIPGARKEDINIQLSPKYQGNWRDNE